MLRALLLGTHRRALSSELSDALGALGIDPELSENERLLEGLALLDRLRRTELPLVPPTSLPEPAPPEERQTLRPKAARALELALGTTYQPALRELLLLMQERALIAPPHLIGPLLEAALTLLRAGQPTVAQDFLALTGERGRWLARQHPEWRQLLPPEDFLGEYRRLVMPSQKAALLARWRAQDPEAARLGLAADWEKWAPKKQSTLLAAMTTGLSLADVPFLRQALLPRRKEVRRLAARLLLKAGEPELRDLFLELAGSWLQDAEGMRLSALPEHLPILEDHGFLDKKAGPEASLLANLPTTFWVELTDRTPLDTFSRLLTVKRAYLPALIDAVVFYEDPAARLALLQYLIQLNLPQQDLTKRTRELYEQLNAEDYARLCAWAVRNVEQVYRPGSVLRQISLQLDHPWPDQFCKLLISEFTGQLSNRRAYYSYVPDPTWKLLPYRINVDLFPWLRQQLYAATDRSDQIGSLATKMLQVVSFRKAARQAFLEKE